MRLGEEGLNDVVFTVAFKARFCLLLGNLTVFDQIFNKSRLRLPEALDVLTERIFFKLIFVFFLELLDLLHGIFAKLVAPIFFQLVKEVLGSLLGIEFGFDGYTRVAHYINCRGEHDVVDFRNTNNPSDVSGCIDVHINTNLLGEGGTKFDLQTSHFAVFTNVHFKFSTDIQRNLDTVFKVAVLTVTGGDIETQFNIICQFKGVAKAVCLNLFFGQLHTVFVIHGDLVVSNIVIEFVAGTHNAA